MARRTNQEAPRLAPEQLAELIELIRGADSVELKLTVPAGSQRATVANLPLDPVEAQPRQVFFFDTPDLRLNAAGVVVRARRIQGGRADTVVKLRPVVPAELPADVRRSPAFNVEVDALPGGFVCSGSMKGRSTGQEVRDALVGTIPLRKLFTKEQRTFFRDHAPADLTFESLVPLGPTFTLKAVFEPKALGRRMVAEMWLYPDGSRILELSTKCLPEEAFQVAAEARAYLGTRGIPISGLQQTKTKTALEFFATEAGAGAQAKQLAASSEPAPAATGPAPTPTRAKRAAPAKAAPAKATPAKPQAKPAAPAKAPAAKSTPANAPAAKATPTRSRRAAPTATKPATTTRRPRTRPGTSGSGPDSSTPPR